VIDLVAGDLEKERYLGIEVKRRDRRGRTDQDRRVEADEVLAAREAAAQGDRLFEQAV
jgi:hypothetical protein